MLSVLPRTQHDVPSFQGHFKITTSVFNMHAATFFASVTNLTSFYCVMTSIDGLVRNEVKKITTSYLLTEILFEGLTKWVVSLT